ncbi:hypothetical protein Tco_1106623 [Tanacetum coccineum]
MAAVEVPQTLEYGGGQMPPKRTSTSEAPAMTQAAIKKLVADSVTTALEAQAATMAVLIQKLGDVVTTALEAQAEPDVRLYVIRQVLVIPTGTPVLLELL